jgi:hypothetical protein
MAANDGAIACTGGPSLTDAAAVDFCVVPSFTLKSAAANDGATKTSVTSAAACEWLDSDSALLDAPPPNLLLAAKLRGLEGCSRT